MEVQMTREEDEVNLRQDVTDEREGGGITGEI